MGDFGSAQHSDDEKAAAETVARGVEAALQILSHGCWDPGIYNADVNRGNRYFANVNNAETYSKNWSWAFSGHNFDAKQSPTLLSYKIPVVNKDGSLNPIGTVVVNAGAAFDLVVKYYPNEGMAITANTASMPHMATAPGYTLGLDPNVNVRWAEIFMRDAPKCSK